MNAFEYLSVLISIILALGMTRVLGGVGEMLQARSHRRIYWVHAIWIINLFLYLVIAWWIFYRSRRHSYIWRRSCSFQGKAMSMLLLITRRTTTRIIAPSLFCSLYLHRS